MASKFRKHPVFNRNKRVAFKLAWDTRLARDAGTLMYEEKFDTWLDLAPTHDLISSEFRGLNVWPDSIPESWKMMVSYETMHQLQVQKISPDAISSMDLTALMPALFLKWSMKKTSHECNKNPSDFRKNVKLMTATSRLINNYQISHFLSGTAKHAKKSLLQGSEIWEEKLKSAPRQLLSLLAIDEDLSEVLSKFKSLHEVVDIKNPKDRSRYHLKKNHLTSYSQSLNIGWCLSRDFIIMRHIGHDYLLTKDLFLEMTNKFSELHSLMWFSYFQSGTNLPDNHMAFCSQFVTHLINHVLKFRSFSKDYTEKIKAENKGFKYLKSIEGLGVAELIHRADKVKGWDNRLLLDTLWEGLYLDKVVRVEGYDTSPLYYLFETATMAQVAEVLGIVKVCGHPSIEVEAGVKELEQRTHAILAINPRTVRMSLAYLKKDLVHNYYLKHRSLPILKGPMTRYARQVQVVWSFTKNLLTEAGKRAWDKITMEMWADVEFGQNEMFDPVDNQLPLIKDKATGLTRSMLFKAWALGPGERMNNALWSERRTLLAFLMHSSFSKNFQEYLHNFMNDDPWTNAVLNYLVIKLTPKELELKEMGRMFGASPNNERSRRIVQDRNAMGFMDNYVPDQLMTQSELDLLRKLYSFRHLKYLHPDHTALQISFDFSKWNNNMRSESIDIPAGALLDPWFGVNLYGKTMKAFENMLVYYWDKNFQYSWEGQLGGIEGLAQATWSYIFLGGIKNALSDIGVINHVTVKGDDVRAVVLVPNSTLANDGLEAFRYRILNQMQILCNDMGWQLNPQESFVSLSVICTSKQYQVNDTWLPAASKKMMKCESLSNLIYPTLEDMVSNIYSTCHSACSQTTTVLPSYLTASIMSSKLLIREIKPIIHKYDEYTYAALLLWPQILGGPGALPLQCFFIRGENDMLSIIISLYMHILKTDSTKLSIYIKKILRQPIKKKRDYSLLLSDPYSIPIASPPRPSDQLKRLLKDRMKTLVRNPDIKKLLNRSAHKEAQEFKLVLLSMKPYVAKLATMLWELSPFYLVEEIIGKFTQSSTVFTFFARNVRGEFRRYDAQRVMNKIVDASIQRLAYWKSILDGTSPLSADYLAVSVDLWHKPDICATEITHYVRNSVWGVEIYALTYPSLIDQNRIYLAADLGEEFHMTNTTGAFTTIMVSALYSEAQTDDNSHHYSSIPGMHPWLGSKTQSRLKLPKLDSQIVSPVLSKILKLVTLLRAGNYHGPNFNSVIKEMISAYTNVDLSGIIALTPEVGGGHIAHRAQTNSYSMVTMPNNRPNIAQVVKVHNENLTLLRTHLEDRTINYAARHFLFVALCTFPLQSMLLLPDNHPLIFSSTYHHKKILIPDLNSYRIEPCEYCCNIVTDVPISFENTDMPDFSKFNDMALVCASEFDEKTLVDSQRTAIIARARRYARGNMRDPQSDIAVNAACMIIINQLKSESETIANTAAFQNFKRIPDRELLDLVAVNLGMRSLMSHGLSLNIYRYMDYLPLYRAVNSLVFQWYLTWASNSIRTNTETVSINMSLQTHKDPLAGMFTKLADAGQLYALVVGCNLDGEIASQLQFHVNSSGSGHVAFMSFLRHHESKYEEYILKTDIPPYIVYSISMEDDTSMMQKLNSFSRTFQYIVSRFVSNFHTVSYTPFRLMNDNDLDISREIAKRRDLRPYDVWAERIMTRLIEAVDQEDQSSIFCFAILSYVYLLPYIVEEGDYVTELTTGEIDFEMEYQVATMPDEFNPPDILPEYNPQLAVNRPAHAYLTKWLGPARMYTIHNMIVAIGEQGESHLSYILYDIWDSVHPKVKDYCASRGKYKLVNMTIEDAERIIKERNLQLNYQIEESLLAPSVQDHEYTVALSSSDDDDYEANINLRPRRISHDYCPKRALVNHHYANLQGRISMTDQDYLSYLGYDNRPYYQANLGKRMSTDPIEIMRCFGGANLAVTSFVLAFNDSPIYRMWRNMVGNFTIVVIGDGSGEITKYLLTQYPNIYIVYCSLQCDIKTLQNTIDGSTTNPIYSLLSGRVPTEMLRRVRASDAFPGDIKSGTVRSSIKRQLDEFNYEIGGVISDMETPGAHIVPLADLRHVYYSVLQLCSEIGRDDIPYFVKLRWAPHSYPFEIINNFAHLFQHIHMSNPLYQKSPSFETYMFLMDPIISGHNLESVCGSLMDGCNISINVERISKIAEVVNEGSLEKAINQVYGIYTTNYIPLLRTLVRRGATLATFQDIWTACPVNPFIDVCHFCDVPERIRSTLQAHIDTWWKLVVLEESKSGKWNAFITKGARSRTIAEGPSSAILSIYKMFNSGIIMELFTDWPSRSTCTVGDKYLLKLNLIRDWYIKYFGFNQSITKSHWKDGLMMSGVRNNFIIWNSLIDDMTKYVNRYRGWMIAMSEIVLEIGNINHRNHLKGVGVSLLGQCCVEKANEWVTAHKNHRDNFQSYPYIHRDLDHLNLTCRPDTNITNSIDKEKAQLLVTPLTEYLEDNFVIERPESWDNYKLANPICHNEDLWNWSESDDDIYIDPLDDYVIRHHESNAQAIRDMLGEPINWADDEYEDY